MLVLGWTCQQRVSKLDSWHPHTLAAQREMTASADNIASFRHRGQAGHAGQHGYNSLVDLSCHLNPPLAARAISADRIDRGETAVVSPTAPKPGFPRADWRSSRMNRASVAPAVSATLTPKAGEEHRLVPGPELTPGLTEVHKPIVLH